MANPIPQSLLDHLAEWPIKIEEKPGVGRYIKATRDIPKGEVVLQARACAVNVSESFRKRACAYCFKQNTSGRHKVQCPKCSRAYYCGEQCKVAHSKVHSKLCEISGRLSSAKFDHDVTSTLQFVIEMAARQQCEKLSLTDLDFLPPLPPPPPPFEPEPTLDSDITPVDTDTPKMDNIDNKSSADASSSVPIHSLPTSQVDAPGEPKQDDVSSINNSSPKEGDASPNAFPSLAINNARESEGLEKRLEDMTINKSIEKESTTNMVASQEKKVGKRVKWVDLEKGEDLTMGKRPPTHSGAPTLRYTVKGLEVIYDVGRDGAGKAGSGSSSGAAAPVTETTYLVNADRIYTPTMADYLALVQHSEEMDKEGRDEWKRAYKYLLTLFSYSKEGLIISETDMFTIIGRLESNGFGFLDPRGVDKRLIGRLVFPAASFFNHSCDPNLEVIGAESTVITLVAKRDIYKGNELNIHYIDIGLPRATRRQKLLEDYMFACACSRCEEEKETGVQVSQHYQNSKNNSKKLPGKKGGKRKK